MSAPVIRDGDSGLLAAQHAAATAAADAYRAGYERGFEEGQHDGGALQTALDERRALVARVASLEEQLHQAEMLLRAVETT